jgi:hypothetical protein
VEFATGWTRELAMAQCDPTMGSFMSGVACPASQRAHCRVIGGDGSVLIMNYYAPLTPSATASHCASLTTGMFTSFYTNNEPTFTCDSSVSSAGFCSEFVSGFTESEAMMMCNTTTATFSSGALCPSGRIAHCTVTSTSGTESVVSYYDPITIDYASMNCDASAPVGSGYSSVFEVP